jgi:DNA-directed RNA polymerase subunit RPC12/RpoP
MNTEKYICGKCEKKFDKLDSYKKHLKKKIPCNNKELTIGYECPNCNNKFTHYTTMYSHLKVCINTSNKDILCFGNHLNLYLQCINPPDFKILSTNNFDLINLEKMHKNPIKFIGKIFKETYIDNISYDKRSIWLLDSSRDKYTIRHNNSWITTYTNLLLIDLFINPILEYIRLFCIDLSRIECELDGVNKQHITSINDLINNNLIYPIKYYEYYFKIKYNKDRQLYTINCIELKNKIDFILKSLRKYHDDLDYKNLNLTFNNTESQVVFKTQLMN